MTKFFLYLQGLNVGAANTHDILVDSAVFRHRKCRQTYRKSEFISGQS